MRPHLLRLAWTAAIAPALAAQQQSADAIPRELAVALIDRFGPSPTPVEIVVGRLPKSLPGDVLPRENVRILGGLERGSSASVVVVVPLSPDSAVTRFAAHLARAGWRRAAEERRMGGFVPRASDRPATFCRANAILNLWTREHQSAGESLVHAGVSYPSDDQYSPCTTGRERRVMYERDLPALPTLESPRGARMLGAGTGGRGPDAQESFTRLGTEQSAADVGSHYAAQLLGAGWTVSPPAHLDGIVTYRVETRDEQQRVLRGVLVIIDIPDVQQLDISLRVARALRDR